MKVKHIIVVCIMAMSVMPIYAQEGSKDPLQSEKTPLTQKQDMVSPKSRDTKTDVKMNPTSERGASGSKEEEGGVFNGIEAEEHHDTATAMNTSGYQAWTPQDESKTDFGGIALIVALIALFGVGYNYFALQTKKSNKKGHHSRQQEQVYDERDFREKMIKTNSDLKEKVVQLTNRVESLEDQLNRISKDQESISKTSESSDNSVTLQHKNSDVSQGDNHHVVETKMYASQVLSGYFPDEGLTNTNNDYAIAILSIKGDTGTFIINDRTSAQSFLISNFAYGAGRVSDVEYQGDSPNRIETTEPGIIRRQGNAWGIKVNAKVKLV